MVAFGRFTTPRGSGCKDMAVCSPTHPGRYLANQAAVSKSAAPLRLQAEQFADGDPRFVLCEEGQSVDRRFVSPSDSVDSSRD